MNKKGLFGIIGIALIVIAFVFGVYFGVKYYIKYGEDVENIVCPDDAMVCPDGSTVSRVLPDCEFGECPDVIIVDGDDSQGCSVAGELAFDDATGDLKECCDGLQEVANIPDADTNQECENYLNMEGFGSICVECGNGICEGWENRCNCALDCLNNTAA
ncbi:MAG: hypothetical protein ABIE22_04335 [archaeon]